jgi:hypothetical protein
MNPCYLARDLAHDLNIGWATLSRYLSPAIHLCQLVGESPGDYILRFHEDQNGGRENIRLSSFGATCLLISMPVRIAGVAELQAKFLGELSCSSIPQPGDRSGFVLALQNVRGLVRFSVSRTPMAPLSKIKPRTPFECRVQCCTWSEDAPRLAALLSDHYREYGSVGDWFEIPKVDLTKLPAIAGGLAGMVMNMEEKSA